MVHPDQPSFSVCFEWGEQGLDAVGPGCAVIVIVDVYSSCTSVDVATSRGAVILPYRWRDKTVLRYVEEQPAILANEYRTSSG